MAVPSSPACMEKAQPDSSKHSLPAQQEPPRVTEETAKVSKTSPRVEDGSLDTGAPSTVSEHVAITKTEPTFTMVCSIKTWLQYKVKHSCYSGRVLLSKMKFSSYFERCKTMTSEEIDHINVYIV